MSGPRETIQAATVWLWISYHSTTQHLPRWDPRSVSFNLKFLFIFFNPQHGYLHQSGLNLCLFYCRSASIRASALSLSSFQPFAPQQSSQHKTANPYLQLCLFSSPLPFRFRSFALFFLCRSQTSFASLRQNHFLLDSVLSAQPFSATPRHIIRPCTLPEINPSSIPTPSLPSFTRPSIRASARPIHFNPFHSHIRTTFSWHSKHSPAPHLPT